MQLGPSWQLPAQLRRTQGQIRHRLPTSSPAGRDRVVRKGGIARPEVIVSPVGTLLEWTANTTTYVNEAPARGRLHGDACLPGKGRHHRHHVHGMIPMAGT